MSRASRQPLAAPPDEPNTGTLLLEGYRAFEKELFRAFSAGGHESLRRKHGAVLANVGREGTRLTDLAVIVGMTKPSMKELVDELIDLGYVARHDDPADKRSRRIVLTRRGLAVARLARQAIEKIEREYARVLGEDAYEALRTSLQQLLRSRPT